MGDDWHEFFEDFPEDKPGWGWDWVEERELEARARHCISALIDATQPQPVGLASVSPDEIGKVKRRLADMRGAQSPSLEVLEARRHGREYDTVDVLVSAGNARSTVVRVGIIRSTGDIGMLQLIE